MKHLFDTCTIKFKLLNPDKILTVAKKCQRLKEKFAISDEILKELRPPEHLRLTLSRDEFDIADDIHRQVALFVSADYIEQVSTAIDLDAGKNLRKIRKQYYGWMSDPNYCRVLIEKGLLKEKEYRSLGFKFKDIGECSLIAISLVNPKEYTLISEDKGRVCAHPDINLFDIYGKKGIAILTFDEWEDWKQVKDVST